MIDIHMSDRAWISLLAKAKFNITAPPQFQVCLSPTDCLRSLKCQERMHHMVPVVTVI